MNESRIRVRDRGCALTSTIVVDDEPFDLAPARVLRFERVLDMQIGVLVREVEFETARGRRIVVRWRGWPRSSTGTWAAIDLPG